MFKVPAPLTFTTPLLLFATLSVAVPPLSEMLSRPLKALAVVSLSVPPVCVMVPAPAARRRH